MCQLKFQRNIQQTVTIIYKDGTKDPIRESTVFQLLKKNVGATDMQ